MTDMTEDQIHDHPDFQLIEQLAAQLERVFGRETTDNNTSNVEAVIDATIQNELLAHLSGHRVMEAGTRYVPAPLLPLIAVGMARMYVEGFMVGAQYQARKDADLVKIDVPDFFPEVAPIPVPETPRSAVDPEQVQAVQDLPQDERRNLFKSMLGKKDDRASE